MADIDFTGNRINNITGIENSGANHIGLKYPRDDSLTGDTWAVFRFVKYDYKGRRDYFSTATMMKNSIATVRLPLPSNMKHSYGTDIRPTTHGMFDEIGMQMGSKSAVEGSPIEGVGKTMAMGALKGVGVAGAALAMENISRGLSRSILGKLTLGAVAGAGLAVDNALQATGYEFNNNIGLAFKGVDLRTFNFSYTFFPESKEDNATIRNIVNMFKMRMHPDYVDPKTKFLFKYPELVTVTFESGKRGNVPSELFAYRVYPAFITDFSVDYSGGGSIFHHEDGCPTSTSISFTLKEIGIMDKPKLNEEAMDMNYTEDDIYANADGLEERQRRRDELNRKGISGAIVETVGDLASQAMNRGNQPSTPEPVSPEDATASDIGNRGAGAPGGGG
jgi:hypothetical protein